MGWSKGTQEHFGGGAALDHKAYLDVLADTNFLSIVNDGRAGIVSGGTAFRLTKSAGSARGFNSWGGLTTRSRSALAETIALYIATGISDGASIIFASPSPAAASIPEVGFTRSGANYHLIIAGIATAWVGTYNMATGTQYYVQKVTWNPTPGTASLEWRCIVVLRDSTGAELERSPIIRVNQGGLTYNTLQAWGLGLSGVNYSATTETPDLILDCFDLVSGGVFGPKLIKTGARTDPTANGTDNAWVLGTGANKYDEVDDIASGVADDDTTYIKSTGSSENVQTFTGAASGITLAGSEEMFAMAAMCRGKVVSGGGTIIARARSGGGVLAGTALNAISSSYAWANTGPLVRSNLVPGFGGDAGNPITVSVFDNAEFGCTRVIGSGTQDKRVTACLMEALYGLPWDDTDPVGSGATMRELDNVTNTRRTKSIAAGVM